MHDLTFPANFMCIGDKSFKWVFENRKEFVDFTLTEMMEPTGLLARWQTYCKEQKKKLKNKDERTQ